jgi:hypothetical protein
VAGVVISRIGTFLWTVPSLSTDEPRPSDAYSEKRIDRLREVLNQDARVITIADDDYPYPKYYRKIFYPSAHETDRNEILGASDGFSVFQFLPSVQFQVQVPVKNQPKHENFDDIPSDNYWVNWDGITVVVGWSQDGEDIPLSGGHVVEQVLRACLEKMGDVLRVQGCSPGCKYLFLHTPILAVQGGGDGDTLVEFRKPEQGSTRHVEALVNVPGDCSEVVEDIALELRGAAEDFADLKTSSRRLIDLEHIARAELAHLLNHYYMFARLSMLPAWRRAFKYWVNRHWKRRARAFWRLFGCAWPISRRSAERGRRLECLSLNLPSRVTVV